MPENNVEVKSDNKICIVRLDRVQLVARAKGQTPPEIPGFSVRRDSFVRSQTRIRTYGRVRNFKNHKTGTIIDVQYRAKPPWLEPIKLTVIAEDSKGLQRAELDAIRRQFIWTRLLTVEIALDFQRGSGVDRSFVLAHGLFGRSALVGGRLFRDLRYGSRHSETLVRAYDKREINCFRVEIELHSSWLRRFGIAQPGDLSQLPALLYPRRIMFLAINWDALNDHLTRKGYPPSTVDHLRSQRFSIHRVMSLLRHEAGLVNVRRFFRPLDDVEISRQLKIWAKRWQDFRGTSAL